MPDRQVQVDAVNHRLGLVSVRQYAQPARIVGYYDEEGEEADRADASFFVFQLPGDDGFSYAYMNDFDHARQIN